MSIEAEVTTTPETAKGLAAVLDADDEDVTTINTAEKTTANQGGKVEKSSNLPLRLRRAEAGHVKCKSRDLQQARSAVIGATDNFRGSRSHFGKALHTYKKYFIADRGWMKAVQAVADDLKVGERTIRNIVADYERVSGLPETVIETAEEQGIDLAKRKHAPLVEVIENELNGKKAPTMPEARELLGKVLKMPAASATKLDKADKVRWTMRMKIRTALTNVAPNAKLLEVLAALEEEMHDVWGVTQPITVTITPKPGILDITGKRLAA
jgi:hypothetical protein